MSTTLLLILVVAAVAMAVGVGLYVRRTTTAPTELEPPPDRLAAPTAEPETTGPEVIEATGAVDVAEPPVVELEAEPPIAPPRATFRDRLGRARGALAGAFGAVLSRGGIDEQTWTGLEEALIGADVGVGTTTDLLEGLRAEVEEGGVTEAAELLDLLKGRVRELLGTADRSLSTGPDQPSIWLFVGVNGVGKTTTIGKLGKQAAADGRSVVMAAGDTFRAAAAEQLGLWADRVGADLVRGSEGADPSSVIYDAVERAAAREADLVLADTAGRLHTKVNLMEELRKVRRVADKGAGQVSEVLLVIDATTGQNGLVQAQQFTDAVDVTGVVLTKLDGSARGGIVLAIQQDLGIPVKLVGLGEGADDLVAFDPAEFVEALFGTTTD